MPLRMEYRSGAVYASARAEALCILKEIEELKKDPDIEYAEPNYIMRIL